MFERDGRFERRSASEPALKGVSEACSVERVHAELKEVGVHLLTLNSGNHLVKNLKISTASSRDWSTAWAPIADPSYWQYIASISPAYLSTVNRRRRVRLTVCSKAEPFGKILTSSGSTREWEGAHVLTWSRSASTFCRASPGESSKRMTSRPAHCLSFPTTIASLMSPPPSSCFSMGTGFVFRPVECTIISSTRPIYFHSPARDRCGSNRSPPTRKSRPGDSPC
jgi:hypothetical protein